MRYETLKRFEDARLACERISEFMAGLTKQEFVASALVRAAVERQLEIIGEALGRRIRRRSRAFRIYARLSA